MFNKRLISMVPQAMRYILRNVAAQWTALVANVVLMLLIGLFLQRLFDGVAIDGWVVMLLGAGVAVIAVRTACLTYAQRMGVAAAAAAKRSVRRQVYDKLVRMGPGYSERIATSEAVQVSVEGCEQLESYFGQYLPQLLYAVLAPLTVFAFLAPLCLPAAVALLVCVPPPDERTGRELPKGDHAAANHAAQLHHRDGRVRLRRRRRGHHRGDGAVRQWADPLLRGVLRGVLVGRVLYPHACPGLVFPYGYERHGGS